MQRILTIMGNLFGSVLLHIRILYSIQASCVLLRLGGHYGRTLAPEAIEFEASGSAHSEP